MFKSFRSLFSHRVSSPKRSISDQEPASQAHDPPNDSAESPTADEAAIEPDKTDIFTYDDYWKEFRGSYGERFVPDVCKLLEFESVLDAGSGEGTVVRRFLDQNKKANGIELSKRAIDENCSDLVQEGIIKNGSLTKLPFEDDSFDLVFSSEVMEHLTAEEAELAVKELVRVSKRYLFLSISLRPSSNFNKYHLTLRPRSWWEKLFLDAGTTTMPGIIDEFQRVRPGASNEEVLMSGPTVTHIDEMTDFVKNPPYSFDGELEPWFFAFQKKSELRNVA